MYLLFFFTEERIKYLYRLYTGPKHDSVSNILSGPAYKKVLENNVDEFSFNDWDVSKEKTLKEPKKAYFSDSESSIRYKYKCQVNYDLVARP